MSDDFKKIAAREIDEFKAEYRARFPGRDADDLTDEDLLREVMNTVGKPGKLGEHVKCVVSVSMLTEGWDANTVTHILGVRAFGTQLLCEQVVGRGLRRMSYAANDDGPFRPRVRRGLRRAVLLHPVQRRDRRTPSPARCPPASARSKSRIACEITFPRLLGYRYDVAGERLTATLHRRIQAGALHRRHPDARPRTRPSSAKPASTPSTTSSAAGPNEVAFLLAKLTLEKYFRDDDGNDKPLALPATARHRQALARPSASRCKDNTFPQTAAARSSSRTTPPTASTRPSSPPTDGDERRSSPSCARTTRVGSTRYVDFDTTRPVYRHPRRQVPHLPRRRRHRLVGAEDGPGARRHARGRPLRQEPEPRLHHPLHARTARRSSYIPDFIACLDDGHGPDDLLNLIVEVTGEKKKDKAAKVATARTLWVPAVNNHGGFGRWAFIEVADPWDAAIEISNPRLSRRSSIARREPGQEPELRLPRCFESAQIIAAASESTRAAIKRARHELMELRAHADIREEGK